MLEGEEGGKKWVRDQGRGRLTPSHATMRKSSYGPSLVSVVYGEPTTNSFIDESPSDLVTARTPVCPHRKNDIS